MNLRLWVLMFAVVVWGSCDAEEAESAVVAYKKEKERAMESRRILQEKANVRDGEAESLKKDLLSEWESVTVAQRYDCSCTGISFRGFQLTRSGGLFQVRSYGRLAGVSEAEGKVRLGKPREISVAEKDKLLSEAVLHYALAQISLNAREKVGPRPDDLPAGVSLDLERWLKEYIDAGGTPIASDEIWMDINISMPDGRALHYENLFEWHDTKLFNSWVGAFGKPPHE